MKRYFNVIKIILSLVIMVLSMIFLDIGLNPVTFWQRVASLVICFIWGSVVFVIAEHYLSKFEHVFKKRK